MVFRSLYNRFFFSQRHHQATVSATHQNHVKVQNSTENEELVSLRKVEELSPVNAINKHQPFFKNLHVNVQAYSSHQCSLQQNSTLQPQLSL